MSRLPLTLILRGHYAVYHRALDCNRRVALLESEERIMMKLTHYAKGGEIKMKLAEVLSVEISTYGTVAVYIDNYGYHQRMVIRVTDGEFVEVK